MKYRILVAEDSPTQAEHVRFVLEEAGYSVDQARNGREALEKIQADPPDLILSDVVMPEMDGFALCQAVKASAPTSRIPVVLLTTRSTPMDIIFGLERGADNFITKPFEAEHLLARLARIFENLAHRRRGGLEMEVSVRVGGREIVINADKQQMIELLFSTSEELSAANRSLEEAHDALAEQARGLEHTVEERTRDLREAETRYRSLVEHVPAVIVTAPFDEPGHITYASPQIEALVGYTPEEVVSDASWFARVLHPDDRERVLSEAARLREPGQRMAAEFRLLARDRRTVWVTASVGTMETQKGSPPLVQGFFVDITERKLTEEQLRQAQKMEAIGQLAGGVAHDFNNLLGVIEGYAGLLAKDFGADARAGRRLEEIRKATERAAALTRQLLAFSRKQVLQPVIVDLNAVLAGMEGMLRRLITADIEVVTAYPEGLGFVRADPSQLEQVILNFVVNARDAMPGGGRLVLETANAELDEEYARTHPEAPPGHYVMLAVTDTGTGMDRATLARVFEPFFTTKEEGKGTGLGLATVYGIVKQSGGHVAVYSEPGTGTTFRVYLPRVKAAAATSAPPASPAGSLEGTETILLAEDAPSLRTMIAEVLGESGYSVLDCGTVEDAISLARSHPHAIHLLLTDVVMPGMSGRDLAAAVEQVRPGIKVVYMSGYTHEALGRGGKVEPGMHFLQKPFTSSGLLGKVRAALDSPLVD
ncbi:MAG TPA: response regulator [Vicinamibacteria bacterium]|nr:response regulator [Vicinamibacteria bacterium]